MSQKDKKILLIENPKIKKELERLGYAFVKTVKESETESSKKIIHKIWKILKRLDEMDETFQSDNPKIRKRLGKLGYAFEAALLAKDKELTEKIRQETLELKGEKIEPDN